MLEDVLIDDVLLAHDGLVVGVEDDSDEEIHDDLVDEEEEGDEVENGEVHVAAGVGREVFGIGVFVGAALEFEGSGAADAVHDVVPVLAGGGPEEDEEGVLEGLEVEVVGVEGRLDLDGGEEVDADDGVDDHAEQGEKAHVQNGLGGLDDRVQQQRDRLHALQQPQTPQDSQRLHHAHPHPLLRRPPQHHVHHYVPHVQHRH